MKKIAKYHPLYKTWKGMRMRCKTKYYLEKNIIVEKEWDNFWQFIEDMGEKPDFNFTLERIDNNKNYCKINCKWANSFEQANNRGKFNKIFTYNNETFTLKQWSRKLNINYTTLYNRIYRSNLTFEDAIKNDPFDKLIEYQNKKLTLKEWANKYNLKFSTCIDRKYQGWDIQKILNTPIK